MNENLFTNAIYILDNNLIERTGEKDWKVKDIVEEFRNWMEQWIEKHKDKPLHLIDMGIMVSQCRIYAEKVSPYQRGKRAIRRLRSYI